MIDFETSSSTTPEREPAGEGDPLRVVRLVTRLIVARGREVVKAPAPFWPRISLRAGYFSTESLVAGAML
jgi:hypothetical protein